VSRGSVYAESEVAQKEEKRDTKYTKREDEKNISSPSYKKYHIDRIQHTKSYRAIVKNGEVIGMFFLPKICRPDDKNRKEKYKKKE
jgi:hypothetical protein